jgi:hypothetical protein
MLEWGTPEAVPREQAMHARTVAPAVNQKPDSASQQNVLKRRFVSPGWMVELLYRDQLLIRYTG